MKIFLEVLKRKWAEYLLEMLVITFGIIAAFMLDSWHDERNNRKEEQVILQGLKEEFEENLQEVKRNIGLNKKSISATYALIDLIRSEERFDNSDLIDSLLVALNMFGTFNAYTGFVDEIIDAGKLSLIRDTKLKKELTSWSSILMNAQEDYDIRVQHYALIMMPYLMKYFPLSNGDLYFDFSSWSKNYKAKKRNRSPFKQNTENINLLELENILWQHKLNNDFVILNELEMQVFINETSKFIESNIK